MRARFENQYLAPLQRELPRHRKPDDARPDHDRIRVVHLSAQCSGSRLGAS